MYVDESGQIWFFEPQQGEYETRLWRKFLSYDNENPQYWEEFVRRTKEYVEAGYKRIGAKLIIELIRWDEECRKNKLAANFSNDFHAYYARKYVKAFPEHKGLFELRPIKRS